jgi:hypothetical protein
VSENKLHRDLKLHQIATAHGFEYSKTNVYTFTKGDLTITFHLRGPGMTMAHVGPFRMSNPHRTEPDNRAMRDAKREQLAEWLLTNVTRAWVLAQLVASRVDQIVDLESRLANVRTQHAELREFIAASSDLENGDG